MKLRGTTTADAAKAETRELEVSAGDVGRSDDKALGGTTLNALPANASGSGITGNVSGTALSGSFAGSTKDFAGTGSAKDFAGNVSARSISNHSRSTYIPPSFRGGVRSTSIPGVPRSHASVPQKVLDNTRTPLTYDEAEAGGPAPVPASEPLRPLLMLLAYTLVATTIYIIIVTVISPRFSVRPISYECNMGTWEMLPVLCFMGLFFMIGCPTLTYWIWKDNDTYGIKRDLVTFAIAGTTVAVMYLLEQTMVPTGKNYGEPTLRLYFGAANWPVIGLLVGHVTSIFLPVLASHNIYPMRPIKRLFRRYRTPSANSSADNISTTRKAKRKSKALPKISWALFASILEDKECFEKFKEFAARDFAAENPLFYDEYRKLMAAVKEAQTPPAVPATIPEGEPLSQPDIEQPSTSNESISKRNDRMSLTDKYPVFDFTPTPPRSFFSAFLGIFPFNRNRLARHTSFFTLAPALPQSAGSVLIPPSLLPAYLTFYKTFIARGAPCQVNLSSHVLENITRQLEREGLLPLVSVFDEAKNAVLDMMYEMFPRFVEAEEEGVLKRFMKNTEKGTSAKPRAGSLSNV
ncbi:hypothetical protein HDU85_002406 [Gaertneriomyces sp. JEL0708]|nr:hypothetical protein HDU85_002406 [Gaertneriomyces sp. JEL0708]